MDKKSIIIVIMIFVVLFSVGVDILMMLALRETKTQVMIHEATTQEMIGKKFTLELEERGAYFLDNPTTSDSGMPRSVSFEIKDGKRQGQATGMEEMKTLSYFTIPMLIDRQVALKEIATTFADQIMKQSSEDFWIGGDLIATDDGDGAVTVLLRQESGVLILILSRAEPSPLDIAGAFARSGHAYRLDLIYRFHAAPIYKREGEQRWEGILKPVTTQPAG